MKHQKVPEPIIEAVNAILSPYGVNLDVFQSENKVDEVRYLSVDAAEKYSGVSRWTIYRAVKSGQLRQIKLSSQKQGKVLFDRLDIDAWLRKMKSR